MRWFKLGKINFNRVLIILGITAGLFFVAFLIWWQKDIEISNITDGPGEVEAKAGSSITGQDCLGLERRPVAIMLANDPETRPLSGISQADLVIEMPVTPNGITRIMAVFQCEAPQEIGSVRSARDDFIPLAASFKALYGHWGGEHDALAKLNRHVVDNIDALIYENTVYYRKPRIPRPHNGFTTLDRIYEAARSLNYGVLNTFSGYPHSDKREPRSISNIAETINVAYPSAFNVQWQYDSQTNTYKRSRGGAPEIDRTSNVQVQASVVVIMKTKSTFLRDQYISVQVTGEGDAQVYQNGIVTGARWKKDPAALDSKFYFYGLDGKEIEFAPGKIWIEIIT